MSKRYQIKKIPTCPHCGDTNYIEFIGPIGIFRYFCDICDRGFDWYEREPKPTFAQEEYQRTFRIVRMLAKLDNDYGRDDWYQRMPMFVMRNSVYQNAKRTLHVRQMYRVRGEVGAIKRLKKIIAEYGYGTRYKSYVDFLVSVGNLTKKAHRRWEEVIYKTEIPF